MEVSPMLREIFPIYPLDRPLGGLWKRHGSDDERNLFLSGQSELHSSRLQLSPLVFVTVIRAFISFILKFVFLFK
jgi:hypothetical protein